MTLLLPAPYPGRPKPLRWTGDAYDRASETGLFDGRRVELINGELLEMAPVNDPHAQAVRSANFGLLSIFPPDKATISIQCPMRLGQSRPLPDLVVVSGTARQVVKHPTSAMLVVEVSDTTLQFDQTEKALLYATHLIPEYWIIDLKSQCLEVRRKPFIRGKVGPKYGELKILKPAETFSLASTPPGSSVLVSDLLP